MGISNSASGFRPGVCTSTTRPTAPFNGQVIYETDTKQTLVWQGTAWVMLTDADSPPGLELVKTQTIGTSVSSVTVSDVFSATYDNYRIIFSGGTCSSSASATIQLSGSTGSTYQMLGYYGAYGTATLTGYSPGVATSWTDALRVDSTRYSAVIELYGPYLAAATSGWTQTQAIGDVYNFALKNTSTVQSTGFTFSPNVGTLTGGTIRVYGYRNS